MKKILSIIAIFSIICSSCSDLVNKKEYKVSIEDNILSIEPNDTCTYQVSVWNENTKLWEDTKQGKCRQGLFSPIENMEIINSIALFALRNNNELSIRVNISDIVDTTYTVKLQPEEGDSIAPIISGNCARLVSNASSKASTETLKRGFSKEKNLFQIHCLHRCLD